MKVLLHLAFAIGCLYEFLDGSDFISGHLFPKLRARPRKSSKLEPEVTMDTTERILYNGYQLEDHYVTSEDGYITRLDRVTLSGTANLNATAKPMLLIHGTLCQSEAWFGNNKHLNLPFLLANRRRDVWVITTRGGQNSLGHTSMSSDRKEYWEFGIDEIAKYDIPVVVDYILNTTGHQQLYVGGHSMGGGLPLVFLSIFPEYNPKACRSALFIRGIFSFGPLGNLKDVENPVIRLAFINEPLIELTLRAFSMAKFLIPLSKKQLGRLIQVLRPIFPLPIIKYIGPDSKTWNMTRSPNYFSSLLTSAPWRHLLHDGQFSLYNGRKGMRKFDFGKKKNRQIYGAVQPPLYNLNKVTAPVHLFRGATDSLISETNVEYLRKRLPNVAAFATIPGYGHLDYLWANDVDTVLYNPIIEYMINNN